MGVPSKQAGGYRRQVLGSREGSAMGVWKVPQVGMGTVIIAGGPHFEGAELARILKTRVESFFPTIAETFSCDLEWLLNEWMYLYCIPGNRGELGSKHRLPLLGSVLLQV